MTPGMCCCEATKVQRFGGISESTPHRIIIKGGMINAQLVFQPLRRPHKRPLANPPDAEYDCFNVWMYECMLVTSSMLMYLTMYAFAFSCQFMCV